MKFIYFFFFFYFTTLLVKSENNPIGARSAAMGHASVSLSDAWSVYNNQAGLGFIRNSLAGISYENRFLSQEIGVKSGAVILPIKTGTFGLSINSFGYSLYNENKYSLSFAKALGDKLAAGIAMDYLYTKIGDGYGNKGGVVGEFGLQTKPLNGLTIGFHVFNPTRTKLADYNNELIPTIIRLGADYHFSEKIILAIETQKDISQNAVFKVGVEYKPTKGFYLRGGIATQPTLTAFGFGFELNNLKIDFASNYHQTLGFCPQLSLIYVFKKKDKGSLKDDK